MSLTTLAGENCWINTSAVVPNSKSEFLYVITNFHFDPASFSMTKDVAESLRSDLIDLFTNDRTQILSSAFDSNLKLRS